MFLSFNKKFINFLKHNHYWLIQSKEKLNIKNGLTAIAKHFAETQALHWKEYATVSPSSKKLSSEHLTSTSSPPAKGQVKRPVKHTWAKKASWGASRMHTEMLHIWYAHVRIQTKRINKSITNSDMIWYTYNDIYVQHNIYIYVYANVDIHIICMLYIYILYTLFVDGAKATQVIELEIPWVRNHDVGEVIPITVSFIEILATSSWGASQVRTLFPHNSSRFCPDLFRNKFQKCMMECQEVMFFHCSPQCTIWRNVRPSTHAPPFDERSQA